MSGSGKESNYFATAGNSNDQRKLSKSIVDLYHDAQAQNMSFTTTNKTLGWVSISGTGGGGKTNHDEGINNDDNNNSNQSKVSVWRLLSFATVVERCWMVFGLLMATLSGMGIPVWLVLLARALDTFSSLGVLLSMGGGDAVEETLKKEMTKLSAAFLIVGAITFISGSLYVFIWTFTGEQQTVRIRKAFVRSVLNQDASWFDRNDREALPTKMGTSIIYISSSIGRTIADTYGLGVSAFGCLAVALWLNSTLALIMLAVIPIIAIIMLIFNCFTQKANRIANDELAVAGSIATEVIAGIKTVAALCAKCHFAQAYANRINSSERSAIRGGFLQSVLAGICGMLFYITYTIAFTIGTNQVIEGSKITIIVKCLFSNDQDCRVTGASVMCCIYAVIISITFIGLMVPGLTAINLGRQAGVHVFGTINRIPQINPSDSSGGRVLDNETLQGRLDFSNIFFSYPTHPEKPICFNLSVTVAAGSSIALCGPSGSGKSTIARFLLRFYDPLQGSISVDGVPLTELNVAWWRSKVGYVEQEPRLFPGTIRDNIAFGKRSNNIATNDDDRTSNNSVSMDEIVDASKAACAHDFIMELPDGYDTFFCGTGVQLSGGQMQRIAIARAIIRKPILLVLDEATSALDAASEKHVTQALANVRKLQKMTTVTIAHRLSTIIDSDLIAVLDEGRVKELGDHKTLYNKDGIYTLLCTTQGINATFTSTDDTTEDVTVSTMVSKKGDIEMGTEYAKHHEVDANSKEQRKNAGDEGVDMKMVEVDMTSMSTIYKYLGVRDGIYALIGIIGSIIVGALSPCEAILMANIVNNFYTVRRDELLEINREWIVRFFYFALTALLGNIFVGVGLSRSGTRLGNKLRKLAFGAMLKRSMGWFDDGKNTTGELTTILGADAEMSMSLVGWEMGYRVRVLSALVAGLAVALAYSWKIAITAIGCMPLIMLASFIQACALRRTFVAKSDGLTPPTILEQGLRGIVSVQAYNLETMVAGNYNKALLPESDGQLSKSFFAGLVYGFTQGVIFITFGIIFYVGTDLMLKGEINFLEFFASLLSIMFGAIGASQVSADFSTRQQGRAAVARILSVMEGPEDEPKSNESSSSVGAATISSIKGGIDLEHAQFSYPLRPDTLIFYESPSNGNNALNLSVPPRESLGIVGGSGSGKSSVLQLILRFYDLTSGTCKIDKSHSISDISIEWLRHQIGYVGQQPTLFTGTVKENIILGKPDASQDEIISAAKAAHAHGFISQLSDGYDTDIGVGGGQLSGGMKQRIAIARAIIRDPKILVLDEATAALDNESEEKVQGALDSLQEKQPRTTLVVAHRLLTVKKCNKIAYLGNGGVIEIGSHDELLKNNGEYSNLWKMQSAEEKLEKKRQ